VRSLGRGPVRLSPLPCGVHTNGAPGWQTSFVALPIPPSGQARRLLGITWQLAGESLRWPVFTELDRRLYSGYDIDVLDAIRAMPPGFLWGTGPNNPLPPGDNQEVGLTVAGIAACPDTDEILSIFVEFIQIAAVTEKAWQPPPGDPAMLPKLTVADFAARAHNLPAAGRGDLLQLLFSIVKTERQGWAVLSPNPDTGEWAVSLTRQIRNLANVRDIDDYWSRRHKPWETTYPGPRPAAPGTTAPVSSSGDSPGSHETASQAAPKTADSSDGPRAAPGAPRDPGAAHSNDALAARLAGASGVQLGSGNVQYNYFNDNPARTGSGGTRPAAGAGASAPSSRGHAFISYVREDSGEVDTLQKTLEEAGIPVWRDTSSLWPGENWSAKIRNAIRSDALVFIACFSTHSAARQRSYQNEELLLAIDQLRTRRPDEPWLIPVRFDDCDIPDFELGAGRTLTSINRADLFGTDRGPATRRLVEAVQRLLQ
jgi:hypothetical protein